MKMRVWFLAVFSVVMLQAAGVFANDCYTKGEAEAEQGIRIHSELMVIGLNCQHMGKRAGMNLYGDYQTLTARHSSLFSEYETVLMEYFRKQGAGNPEASLNTLRTQFANKISKDAAGMRPDVFCAKYAPRITQASAMSREEIKSWAGMVFPSHPVSHGLCSG